MHFIGMTTIGQKLLVTNIARHGATLLYADPFAVTCRLAYARNDRILSTPTSNAPDRGQRVQQLCIPARCRVMVQILGVPFWPACAVKRIWPP